VPKFKHQTHYCIAPFLSCQNNGCPPLQLLNRSCCSPRLQLPLDCLGPARFNPSIVSDSAPCAKTVCTPVHFELILASYQLSSSRARTNFPLAPRLLSTVGTFPARDGSCISPQCGKVCSKRPRIQSISTSSSPSRLCLRALDAKRGHFMDRGASEYAQSG
jgi:hypothetical protein